jgi:hypothetical protein
MPTGNLKRGKLVFILMRSASEHVNQYLWEFPTFSQQTHYCPKDPTVSWTPVFNTAATWFWDKVVSLFLKNIISGYVLI